MNLFWWIMLGLFAASSIYMFYWIYKFYIVIKELVISIKEIYRAIKKA